MREKSQAQPPLYYRNISWNKFHHNCNGCRVLYGIINSGGKKPWTILKIFSPPRVGDKIGIPIIAM